MKIGPFEVLGELGRGGMGVVYRVRAPDGKEAALKLLKKADPSTLARFEHIRCEASNCDDASATRELGEERLCRAYFGARRTTVRRCGAGMCRNHVPEEHVVGDTELFEHTLYDRRACLGGTVAGQLPLRRERDAAHTCAAVAGSFADESRRTSLPASGMPVC